MARYDKYDLSDSAYTMMTDEKITRYNNLIRQAERTNMAHGGQVSKEEATFYYQAAKVCEEMMNLNLSERAIYARWKQNYDRCEAMVQKISDILAPKPAPKPQAAPEPEAGDEIRRERRRETAAPEETTGEDGRKIVQTKSGFRTRNAVKDVPADTIESWYRKEKPKHDFSGVTGMEELKRRLNEEVASLGWDRIDAALHISPVQSYFFYGPPGSGKTYLIEAFASELMSRGFKYIRLLGGDIHASLVGVAEKTVQIAFKEAIDNEPCLIFIDEVEDVCVDRNSSKAEGHEKRLTVAFLEAYNLLRESGKRVIFMGATNHPGQVDSAMLDRVKLIRIPLPDEKTREAFFTRKLDTLTLEEGFTYADMAAVTDNYSYRDLESLTDTIAIRTKHRTIENYRVENEGGNMDVEQTDIAGSEALRSGEILLTRELFEQTRRELPPSDKSRVWAELKAFEEKMNPMNG